MTNLDTPVQFIKGVGEKRAGAFKKLGIETLFDLISHFPRAYEDRRRFVTIGQIQPGEQALIRAVVANSPRLRAIRRGLDLVELDAVDDTGRLHITFFNQPYVRGTLRLGGEYVFYGKADGTQGRPALTNPIFERADAAGRLTGRIVPIYRLTAGLSQTVLINAVSQGLSACDEVFPDYLPGGVRLAAQLSVARFAYHNIHFPQDEAALSSARKRLIFEELFVLSAALGRMRSRRSQETGIPLTPPDLARFEEALPFPLTNAQRRAVKEVTSDLCGGGAPMSRLIQGDVGSGKTVVAAAAAWTAFSSGYQSAMMAPTEILAVQHYKTLTGLLAPLGMRVGLLTGSLPAKEKRALYTSLETGYCHLVVGTHALLSGPVAFQNPALFITDEQHRFGVEQRAALTEKGQSPHVLVMSATPIPRTLALILYGDLDISLIDELPPGRQSVDTFAVGASMRARIMAFTRKLVKEGRQAYFICPMVEEGADSASQLKAVRAYADELQTRVFPELRVGFVHGKMKVREKQAAMAAFEAGETDILVSTTVIEVGVDVPNAALMVVENAERFGLSQLHQLRGRVGRGGYKSYCVLFSESADAADRLKILCDTGDGFAIAREDLRLRGPGDFFGARQHGLPELKIADLSDDITLLREAQAAAEDYLKQDPALQKPEAQALRQRINTLFRFVTD